MDGFAISNHRIDGVRKRCSLVSKVLAYCDVVYISILKAH